MSYAKERAQRIENIEAGLSITDLVRKWSRDIGEVQVRVDTLSAVEELVDNVRNSNLRASLARARGLITWEDKWFMVKYALLVKALEMRASGVEGIHVNHYVSEKAVSDENRERLMFAFGVLLNSYSTKTAVNNLVRIVPKEKLMDLIGVSDPDLRILPGKRNRHRDNYNFGGLRHSEFPFNRTTH